ncbi:MAG: methionine--tRNA ligase subunit beta, partial [Bacteroidales bacterium]|nr:methionine--tRNA ligase subunit beta [Bacteroidales bacterium]
NVEPQKAAVSYDDFAKMDIRVAEVLEAELVPKTKKLMKLTLNTGMDKRVVVSGIAESFKPEEVVGRKVCLLANLEPKPLKGIESHGMILMSQNPDGKLHFVEPAADARVGMEIR